MLTAELLSRMLFLPMTPLGVTHLVVGACLLLRFCSSCCCMPMLFVVPIVIQCAFLLRMFVSWNSKVSSNLFRKVMISKGDFKKKVKVHEVQEDYEELEHPRSHTRYLAGQLQSPVPDKHSSLEITKEFVMFNYLLRVVRVIAPEHRNVVHNSVHYSLLRVSHLSLHGH